MNGWYPHPVTVTLTAVVGGAGVFQTQYRVNGGSSWQIYGGPFTISQAGIQTVVYQSTNSALNIETSHTLTLPLDLARRCWTADRHLHYEFRVNNYVKTQGND